MRNKIAKFTALPNDIVWVICECTPNSKLGHGTKYIRITKAKVDTTYLNSNGEEEFMLQTLKGIDWGDSVTNEEDNPLVFNSELEVYAHLPTYFKLNPDVDEDFE